MNQKQESFESTPQLSEVTSDNMKLLSDIRGKLDEKKTDAQLLTEADSYATSAEKKAFLVQAENEVAGFVQIVLRDEELPKGCTEVVDVSGLAHLARIGVLEDYRGRGLAKRLLVAAEEYVSANGKRGMWLDYLAENEAAAALYMSSGYNDVAEFRDGDKERLRRIAVKYF